MRHFCPSRWAVEGYFICNWSIAPHRLWDRIQEFAYVIADRDGGVVMDERFFVLWPRDARGAQEYPRRGNESSAGSEEGTELD